MTGEVLRVSARTLAEFTFFQEDIVPSSLRLMQAGMRGHLARQQAAGGKAEVHASWEGMCEGLCFKVTGRIDLMPDLTPLEIEEIKLCAGDVPPAVKPAHRAQALVYAFMYMAEAGLPAMRMTVRYVLENGQTAAAFSEDVSFDAAREGFFALLVPYARHVQRLIALRDRRDTSLLSLPFPYATYRLGQREMAAQVYTAIQLQKKLFAVMPTGTGKSAAVLYPAVKALGQGLTGQIFYLTARTTQGAAALKEMHGMVAGGADVRTLTLTAKEKTCPMEEVRCDPEHCARARGHFVRQQAAIEEALALHLWEEESIQELSAKYSLCPFEFSLSLIAYADVVVCDYNYAFDPHVLLQRVFEATRHLTLLIDEAHNLPGRVRDMLSSRLSGRQLTLWRREAGKRHGRSSALYKALTGLIAALRALPEETDTVPAPLWAALDRVLDPDLPRLPDAAGRELYQFASVARRQQDHAEDYCLLVEKEGKEQALSLFCLHFTQYLAQRTRGLRGCVFFSATLSPLQDMRTLLGGGEEDACFSLLSPFPPEYLKVLHLPVNTRYAARQTTAPDIALAIQKMYRSHPGKYITYFPSYAYLQMVADLLEETGDLPLHIQQRRMGEEERKAYLARFLVEDAPVIGLCVLGGVFAEGIDLPGLSLVGVGIVGVGLPTVSREQEQLRTLYDQVFDAGFDHAYRFPGMHKVLQASGRLIRSETDRGVVLLMDDRYAQPGYQRLLPPHYDLTTIRQASDIEPHMQAFWAQDNTDHIDGGTP